MRNYQKNKGRGKDKFVQLPHRIMDSDAYKVLPTNRRAVLIEVIRRYNGNNNGEIPLSCREAGKLCNISKDTATICFNDLIEVGLLRENNDNFHYIANRQSRRWFLTHLPSSLKGSKKAPTNEWREFKKSS